MKKHLLLILLIVLPFVKANANANYATTRIIIKFKQVVQFPNQDNNQNYFVTGINGIDALNEKYNCIRFEKLGKGKKQINNPLYVIHFNSDINIEEAVNNYQLTGELEYAEPDYKGEGGGVIPNDQYFFRQWSLVNTGTFSLFPGTIADSDIDMDDAWMITQGDATTVITIIDSGMRLQHPEVAGRIWTNTGEIAGNLIDDDGNGYIDDVEGYDWAYSDNDPTDDVGHGTNITGIVAANANNSIGYAGINWNCKVMELKALDVNNSGYYSWWTDAIYYAVDNGTNIINMSMGGSSNSTTMEAAIDYAFNNNVTVTVCMMNFNNNVDYYPAAFTNVIATGSTDPDDDRSVPFSWSTTSGSNYGNHIDVCAPGNYIYGLSHTSNTAYGVYWSGTSMAAPHVAGLASLMLAVDNTLTPSQIKNIIESTAQDLVGAPLEDTPGWDQYHGWGRINANAALQLVVSVKEATIKNAFSIFPNPAKNIVNISVKEILNDATIKITDVTGKTVLLINNTNASSRFTIPVSGLSDGIYFVQLLSNNKSSTQKLIIKK
jgi:subtilisin family serine protease